jgi:hypothetical protein
MNVLHQPSFVSNKCCEQCMTAHPLDPVEASLCFEAINSAVLLRFK